MNKIEIKRHNFKNDRFKKIIFRYLKVKVVRFKKTIFFQKLRSFVFGKKAKRKTNVFSIPLKTTNIFTNSPKNSKIFILISQTVPQNFAFFTKKWKRWKIAKMMQNFAKYVFKKKNSTQTNSAVAATINCAKKWLEFFALRAKH